MIIKLIEDKKMITILFAIAFWIALIFSVVFYLDSKYNRKLNESLLEQLKNEERKTCLEYVETLEHCVEKSAECILFLSSGLYIPEREHAFNSLKFIGYKDNEIILLANGEMTIDDVYFGDKDES